MGGACNLILLWGLSKLDDGAEQAAKLVGIVVLGAILLYVFLRKRKTMEKRTTTGDGRFDAVRGQVNDDGVTLWSGGHFPTNHVWGDFVGYRYERDVLVLYTSYPDEFVVLSAALLGNHSVWQQLVETAKTHVPKISRWARKAPRPQRQRFTMEAEAMVLLKEQRWGAVSYTHLTLPTICSV